MYRRVSRSAECGNQDFVCNFFDRLKTLQLTLLPRIWLIAALSFNVHSATTFALISFMYNMKAFRGFLMCGFFFSSVRHTPKAKFLIMKYEIQQPSKRISSRSSHLARQKKKSCVLLEWFNELLCLYVVIIHECNIKKEIMFYYTFYYQQLCYSLWLFEDCPDSEAFLEPWESDDLWSDKLDLKRY